MMFETLDCTPCQLPGRHRQRQIHWDESRSHQLPSRSGYDISKGFKPAPDTGSMRRNGRPWNYIQVCTRTKSQKNFVCAIQNIFTCARFVYLATIEKDLKRLLLSHYRGPICLFCSNLVGEGVTTAPGSNPMNGFSFCTFTNRLYLNCPQNAVLEFKNWILVLRVSLYRFWLRNK